MALIVWTFLRCSQLFDGDHLSLTQNMISLFFIAPVTLQEADTMDMLNAQSKTGLADGSTVLFQSNGSVRYEKMKYYLVSAPWLRKAWRHVLKPPPRVSKDWREIVDCIDNSSLVETKASSSVSQHQQQSAGDPTNGDDGPNGSYTLRKDMLHEKHFYLVGSHAWLLLSKKFGCTHELSAVVRVHKRNESSLVVDPHSSGPLYLSSVSNGHSGLIPIPASGRFPYATNLDDGLADTFEDNAMRNPQDDEGPFHSTFNQKASVHIIPSHVASGDRQQVSDDSDNEQDVSCFVGFVLLFHVVLTNLLISLLRSRLV